MTHLQVDTDYVNCGFDNASSIELINVDLKDEKPPNVGKENNTIFWVIRETDGSQSNGETRFPAGFYTLEDIQTTLNNDLKYKGCSIQLHFKYDQDFKKITLFKVKPPTCRVDLYLLGNSLMKSLGFENFITNFPASNNKNITLSPYSDYRLYCDILDPNKNLVNGEPSKLLCHLNYPFSYSVKKTTINRFSQINFDVFDSNDKKVDIFKFFFLINGT